MIEEEKSSKWIGAFVAMLFGIVMALPIIGLMYEDLTPKQVFIIFFVSCTLSAVLNYFFPRLYLRILGLFSNIDF